MEKDIIILAKSYKHSPNFCIAGIDISTGEWVRPISNNKLTEGAVPPEDIRYENGDEVNLLDIVKIKFIKTAPTPAQPENHLYDSSHYWTKIRNGSLAEVVQKRGFDDCDYVFYNTNKNITDSELPGKSLLLLKIQKPEIFIKTFPERRSVAFNFLYNGVSYKYFQVSDISLGDTYKTKSDGSYILNGEKIAVFSLTGKYEKDGKYYKMLAQIF